MIKTIYTQSIELTRVTVHLRMLILFTNFTCSLCTRFFVQRSSACLIATLWTSSNPYDIYEDFENVASFLISIALFDTNSPYINGQFCAHCLGDYSCSCNTEETTCLSIRSNVQVNMSPAET